MNSRIGALNLDAGILPKIWFAMASKRNVLRKLETTEGDNNADSI